jgi:outer membrane protein assembly factor BamB
VPAIYHQQMTGLPIPITERDPHISTAIEAALLRAMAKEPAQRFDTVADFNQALRRRTVRKTSPHREPPYLAPEPRWQQTFDGEITAVFASNGSPIFVAAEGVVAALSSSGEQLWQVQADGRISHFIYQADIVIGMTAVGTLYAWRPTNGSLLWQYTATVVPHMVYWLNGLVVIVLPDGEIIYLNSQDGSLVKHLVLQTGPPATAVAAFSGDQLLLATGNVLAGYSTQPKEDAE